MRSASGSSRRRGSTREPPHDPVDDRGVARPRRRRRRTGSRPRRAARPRTARRADGGSAGARVASSTAGAAPPSRWPRRRAGRRGTTAAGRARRRARGGTAGDDEPRERLRWCRAAGTRPDPTACPGGCSEGGGRGSAGPRARRPRAADAARWWSMRLRLAEHRADLPPVVGGEVASAPGCGGRWPCRRRAPGRRGRGTGRRRAAAGASAVSRSFGACGWPPMRGQGEEVVEAGDAEGRGPLEQQVEQVGGGQGVVEGAVGRPVVEPEPVGEGAEPAVGHLVADEAPGQGAGVDRCAAPSRGPAGPHAGRRRGTTTSKRRLWPTSTASPMNSRSVGSTASIRRRRHDHRLGDAGEHGDRRRDARAPGLTSVWKVPRHSPPRTLTAPISVMPHVAGVAAGGLEVEHAERDVVQRACRGRRSCAARRGDRPPSAVIAGPYRTGVRRTSVRCGASAAGSPPYARSPCRCPRPATAAPPAATSPASTSSRRRRTRAFHHYTVGGELSVEDEEVLDEVVESVACRWCGTGAAGRDPGGRPGLKGRPTATALLRPALEAAMLVAREGERADATPRRRREPLRRYLNFARLPDPALEVARRVLDDDADFRDGVTAAVDEERVGRAGWLFLDPAGRGGRPSVDGARPEGGGRRAGGEGGPRRARGPAPARRRRGGRARGPRRRRVPRRHEAQHARAELEAERADDRPPCATPSLACDRSWNELRGSRATTIRRLKEAETSLAKRNAELRSVRHELADGAGRARPGRGLAHRRGRARGASIRRRGRRRSRRRGRAAIRRSPRRSRGDGSGGAAVEQPRRQRRALLGGDRPEPVASESVEPPRSGPDAPTRRSRARPARRRPAPLPPGVLRRRTGGRRAPRPHPRRPRPRRRLQHLERPVVRAMPPAEQRARLLDACAELHARWGTDGRGRLRRRPATEESVGSLVRSGVRYRFTTAGVEADDVILDRVDEEPAARPIVVVSSATGGCGTAPVNGERTCSAPGRSWACSAAERCFGRDPGHTPCACSRHGRTPARDRLRRVRAGGNLRVRRLCRHLPRRAGAG